MDANGEVRNSPFPSPGIYRSRGATPLKTPSAAHTNAGGTLRLRPAGPAALKQPRTDAVIITAR
jgi:hypothetical protein